MRSLNTLVDLDCYTQGSFERFGTAVELITLQNIVSSEVSSLCEHERDNLFLVLLRFNIHTLKVQNMLFITTIKLKMSLGIGPQTSLQSKRIIQTNSQLANPSQVEKSVNEKASHSQTINHFL